VVNIFWLALRGQPKIQAQAKNSSQKFKPKIQAKILS